MDRGSPTASRTGASAQGGNGSDVIGENEAAAGPRNELEADVGVATLAADKASCAQDWERVGTGGGGGGVGGVVGGGGGAGGGEGRGGKRGSRQSATSVESAASSDCSSATKVSKRLAKKAPSMSPAAKWRRLRNTLKAAHEMQSHKKKQALSRDDSFLRKFSTRNQRLHYLNYPGNDDGGGGGGGGGYPSGVGPGGGGLPRNPNEPRSFKPPRNLAVQHDGNFMFNWLGVVTVAVLYNLWSCILREAFHEVQHACHACWFTCDVLVDLVYLLDVLVQFRTGYLYQGLMVYDSKKMARRYIQSRLLFVDLVTLLPLDFLQFHTGPHPMLRFPRFLKVYRTFRFNHMLESRTAYPNVIRVANLTHILFLGAHWFAAFYYMISEAEDFRGQWSYPRPVAEFASVSRKYLASLFWSTLTLTTIGALPPPDNGKDYGMSDAAYVFVILSYLIGVFVFATIVGQVGNVINNKNASRQEFERLLDGAKVYMQTHNVPSDLQKRVQRWYDYVWSRGRLNGCDINSLGLLPDKLKTELAIHVNLETLKKVTIFQECQPEFLHDLVLKMKAYIFTPGDLICRRGEVAREMFIIADGVVEIISESGTVLKQMGAGDFFGEIGILNLDGGINRRTADVKSVGYSELFVLSRDDVLGALKDHPDAESIIRDYGQRRLREIEAHRQLVKPLKQLGTASHKLLNMRNSATSARSNVTSATPNNTAAATAGGAAAAQEGGPASGGVLAHARGNSYKHRLLMRSDEAEVGFSNNNNNHHNNADTSASVSAAASSRDPIPKRLTRAFYNSPSGYTAVLTEEEETSRTVAGGAGHTVVEVNSEERATGVEGPPPPPSPTLAAPPRPVFPPSSSSFSFSRNPECPDQPPFIRPCHTLPDCSPTGLEVFHGNSSPHLPHPCIRVESASTLDSDSTADKVSLVEPSANFLHPDYQPQTEEDEAGRDVDDDALWCIHFRALLFTFLILTPLPRCPPRGLLWPWGLWRPLPLHAASVFSRDGCKRHNNNATTCSSETITDSSARATSWTPATDPLLHVQEASRDPEHMVSEQNEYLTSLLVQLQFSHEQLHSRMSELETAYLSNRERLDRLGAAQADMMALLHAQVFWDVRATESEEDVTAL
ncbi:uncharacterized protein LOC143287897 [Babylonia areolata]|uniref:uncharacterized protein LOC143287897 n=1 Tax=Babylonia areolata TaxID=304850 RepID=UPI003FD50547